LVAKFIPLRNSCRREIHAATSSQEFVLPAQLPFGAATPR
jgi:hypothetical protein